MPAAPARPRKQNAGASPIAENTIDGAAPDARDGENKLVRLHITPFNPALLKVYLPPAILPLAQSISYHTVETFPEKGFGFIELPAMEAQKLKKKLNGSTLKGSKVRIEDAKPEKRKAAEDAEAVEESGDRPSKRTKRGKVKKEQGVLEGVELSDNRKVKRGWTESPVKGKDKKIKEKEKKEKGKKGKQKESKYTKEPEMLFKTKLTPVAAAEVAYQEKSKDKKKDKKKSKSKRDAVVHEFEKNSKQPTFLKASKVSSENKPAIEYVNGKGWVDEDGVVVEAETGKARNRRVLELVDSVPAQQSIEKRLSSTPSPRSSPAPKPSKTKKTKKVTPPPSSPESEDDESSVVSSSSEDESSQFEEEAPPKAKPTKPARSQPQKSNTPEIALTPSSPGEQGVHPLEALFKPSKKPSALLTPGSNSTSTPAKGLAPINTSFSFFDNNAEPMDVDEGGSENPPITPFTQRDLEWRGLRSAAPTPDTAAIGRRFSFPWRNSSQEADDAEEDDDPEAEKQLSNNTKANASATHLPDVAEEEEEDGGEKGADDKDEEEKPESEFRKWFWENQGGLNRAWKKRRRDALKAKRQSENKRAIGGRRAV